MQFGASAYVAAFFASAAMALFLTPVALRIARRREIFDHPGNYKVQDSPVPYLGGTAIVIAFSLAVIVATLLSGTLQRGVKELVVVMSTALFLSLMGLLDDVRGLNLFVRMALEVLAALLIWWVGIRIDIFHLDVANGLLTVLWIVGITNAFNLLDNMDGLSAGIAAICAAVFLLLAATSGQFLVAGLSAALAGCAMGFLWHNFHPARIYMGDAGSLFFGFVLSVVGIKLRFDAPTQITFMVPILVLGVPIFDTLLVVTTRLMHRLNPLSGGRDHTSHRLVFVGLPVPVAVTLIYAGQIALGWLALIMSQLELGTGFLLMGFVVAIGSFFAILLGAVPVHEKSTRRRMMIREVSEHEVEPKDSEGESIRRIETSA